jgi:hypothetical protein
MKRSLLSSLIRSFDLEGSINQHPVTYHVWTNSGGNEIWDVPGNWHNNQVPGETSNVLFADYQQNCVITGEVPRVKSVHFRPTYTTNFSIYADQNLLVREDIRMHGGALQQIGRATIVTQSGNLYIDGDNTIFWANAKIFVSGGNAVVKPASLYGITGFVAMYGSGVTFESDVPLPGFRLYGNVSLADATSTEVFGVCDLNGTLTIPSGSEFIVTSNDGEIYANTGNMVNGDGLFIIQQGAQFKTQNGEFGCTSLVVQDYGDGIALKAGTYTAKNIIFRDSDGTDDIVLFDSGHYVFNADVYFESWHSGVLEIQNDVYSPQLQFNKNVTLTGTSLGQVIWSRGDGIITLGKPTGIEREFTRYSEGRTAVNRSLDAIGMAQGRATLFSNMPILWIKDGRLDNTPLKLQTVHSAFHSYGTLTLSGATGMQCADIAVGIRPGGTGSFIYIADIADSGGTRNGSGAIYRVSEPVMSGANKVTGIYERFNVAFTGEPFGEAGGLVRDVRAIMVGTGGDIYCISHRASGTQLFKIAAAFDYTGINAWQYMANLSIPTGVVAADIASDGSLALIKTYNKVYYFTREDSQSIDFMLTGTTPNEILNYVPDWQEESIAIGSGAHSFYTLAKYNPEIHNVSLRSPIWLYKKHEHIRFLSQPTERIVMNAPNHTKVFSLDSFPRSFAADYGIIHFSGTEMTTEGDFYVGPGADFDYRGFPNSVLNVGGDYLVVGSSSRLINMINFNDQPDAYTNVSGTATVYWANVGNNNASGGSTVYAYFCNDHSGTHNWTFAPVELIGATTPLYIHQDDNLEADNDLPIYAFGMQDRYQDTLFLVTEGSTINPAASVVYLYLSGSYPDTKGSLPMYMGQSGIRGSMPLVIRGTGAGHNESISLYISQSGGSSFIPMYIAGHLQNSGELTMYMVGKDTATSGINMYMGAVGLESRGMRIYTHGRHASN